jgi:hypothetical protein
MVNIERTVINMKGILYLTLCYFLEDVAEKRSSTLRKRHKT